MDRLPLPLWDNLGGNLTNVMLRTSGDVVGIDQQVNPLKDGAVREPYLGRVRSLVGQLFGAAGTANDARYSPGALSECLRRSFRDACNVSLSDADMANICEGLRSGLRDAVSCLDSGALREGLDDAVAMAGRSVVHGGGVNATLPPAQDAMVHAEFVER